MPAFVVKVNNLVHFGKLLSDSLYVSFLYFVVSPTPLTPIAALTYDSVILSQHACVARACSVFLPTCGLPVPQIRKGWESECFISCFE